MSLDFIRPQWPVDVSKDVRAGVDWVVIDDLPGSSSFGFAPCPVRAIGAALQAFLALDSSLDSAEAKGAPPIGQDDAGPDPDLAGFTLLAPHDARLSARLRAAWSGTVASVRDVAQQAKLRWLLCSGRHYCVPFIVEFQ